MKQLIELFLGVDPGRCKIGLALVCMDGSINELLIARSESFDKDLQNFCKNKKITAVVLGDGTHSKEIAKKISELLPELPQYFVGEAFSTEEARKLYWQENPPRGLKKMIPLGLLVPPEPLDAYAAVVQVRRWLNKKRLC